MAHEHKFDWRDCDKVDHEEGCFVASCDCVETRDCRYQQQQDSHS